MCCGSIENMNIYSLEPRRFSQEPPQDLKKRFDDFACVSLILNTQEKIPEIAFIRRALNPKDPWSGHIAFPGGRAEKSDPSDLATALRETKEEVGWDLSEKNFLGYLTDIQARNRSGFQSFFLRPLVFSVSEPLPLNRFDPLEVAEVMWISLMHLQQDQFKTTLSIAGRGDQLPGIQFPNGSVLWGLTYQIIQELIEKLKQESMT